MMNNKIETLSASRSTIWFGIIGAFLAATNNIIAFAALGVFQGPLVAFTTPFAFCFGKLLYPRLPSSTFIFLPVVIVSIFTINFGPPGPYKIFFLIGAVLYDVVCYILRVGSDGKEKVALWKLIIATLFYPVGLLIGALIAISWVAVELPILSQAWIGAILLIVVFGIVGSFATWLCHRVFYKWIVQEMAS